MPFLSFVSLLLTGIHPGPVFAEAETIDLKALAKKARPAVMLLVVSDSSGKEIATGTGFLVSADGKLITNHHVIEKAAGVVAKAENGGLFPVEGVLASDVKNDLVLLKLNGKDLPFLTLGNSDNIEVGTRIAVIGSPLGLEGTLSEGIVSAIRDLMGERRSLQITAAISPGSSGSPVLNAKGEIVGVAVSLLKEGQSLNFAIPAESMKKVLADGASKKKITSFSEITGEDERGLESDPDYKDFVSAGLAGDDIKALKLAKALVSRFPDSPRAWNGLGGMYYNLGSYTNAADAFRQSIKCKPDYANSWECLGASLQALGKDTECIDACQQALRLKPDNHVAWDVLGDSYSNLGQFTEAVAAYQQAVRLKPDYAGAWRDLGTAYLNAGRTDEAREAFQKAKQLKAKSSK
jgi:Tfp pilus assembly protein PilF